MPTTCKLIAKTILSSGATEVDFTSIPGTFTDLLLIISARMDRVVGTPYSDDAYLRFNGSSSNYSERVLTSTGGSISSYTGGWLVGANSSDSTSNTFASTEIYIPNYAGSTNKSISSTFVVEHNGTNAGQIQVAAGLWSDTSAITSVKVTTLSTRQFVSNSSFFLYGITKA